MSASSASTLRGNVHSKVATLSGVTIAFGAAIVSGVSVFVNGYGVKAFGDPTVYTTAKNLVAAVVLGALLVAATRRGGATGLTRPRGRRQWLGLVAVGVVGGSVPFVLFFEGLARATSVEAAFLQKTLVVWVVLLAVPILHERIGVWHVVAIGALLWGQAAMGGGLGDLGFGTGEVMILAATILWAIEVVIAKRLLGALSPLTVAAARMGIGIVLLIVWTLATTPFAEITAITGRQWSWVLITGGFLSAYVAVWFTALARAQAVDVTAVLVFGAFVTAMLQATVQGAALAPQAFGLGLVVLGTAVMVFAARRTDLVAGAIADPARTSTAASR
jgi:drug/metabolite transporter (DMT)-like permease